MNKMSNEIPGVISLVKQSFAFYIKSYKDLIWIGIIPWLFNITAELLINSAQDFNKTSLLVTAFIVFVLVFIFAIANLIIQFTHQIALIKGIDQLDKGNSFSLDELYKSSFKLFFPFLWVTILTSLVFSGAFLLLIIPGIALSLYLFSTIFYNIIDGKRGLNALFTSFYYARGNWWRIFVRLLGSSLILLLMVLIILAVFCGLMFALNPGFSLEALLNLLQSPHSNMLFSLFSIAVSFLVYCVIGPISILPAYIIYKYLKTIKPEPNPEIDFKISRRWVLGFLIWGIIVLVASIATIFVAAVLSVS